MTKQIFYPDFCDVLEYHGNTAIEITRKQNDVTIEKDWMLFDSVEEAEEYFNESY